MLEIIRLEDIPLVCVRPIGHPSDEELGESLQRISTMIESEQRARRKVVMIVDMRKAGTLSAGQRRIASSWMKQNFAAWKQVALGSAFIIDSPVVRGVLTALLWLQPLDMPYDVVKSLEDAKRWAFERLEAEHIPVPERNRRERSTAAFDG